MKIEVIHRSLSERNSKFDRSGNVIANFQFLGQRGKKLQGRKQSNTKEPVMFKQDYVYRKGKLVI